MTNTEITAAPAAKFMLEMNGMIGFQDVEAAREAAAALVFALGSEQGLRIREVGSFRPVSIKPPAPLNATRNKQVAEGTAASIAKNFVAAVEAQDNSAFPPVIALDETTRIWNVDFNAMVENVRNFPSDTHTRDERLAAFQKAVSETLMAEALRGIKMK